MILLRVWVILEMYLSESKDLMENLEYEGIGLAFQEKGTSNTKVQWNVLLWCLGRVLGSFMFLKYSMLGGSAEHGTRKAGYDEFWLYQ